MSDNQLIQYEGGLIKRVGKAITITNKLLSVNEPQLIPYRKNDKWGFCTPDKKIVIPCIYDDAHGFNKGLAKVKLHGKYGYTDKFGNLIIPCIYDYADIFCEGLASVAKNRKYGYIDKAGNIIIPFIYENIDNLYEISI